MKKITVKHFPHVKEHILSKRNQEENEKFTEGLIKLRKMDDSNSEENKEESQRLSKSSRSKGNLAKSPNQLMVSQRGNSILSNSTPKRNY